MFSPDTPKIISRLYDIIAAVERACTGRFQQQHQQRRGERAVVFLTGTGAPFFYFGAWYELWSRSGFPLWYGVHAQWDQMSVEKFMAQHPEAVFCEGYHLCRVDCAPVFEDGPVEPVVELVIRELEALERT